MEVIPTPIDKVRAGDIVCNLAMLRYLVVTGRNIKGQLEALVLSGHFYGPDSEKIETPFGTTFTFDVSANAQLPVLNGGRDAIIKANLPARKPISSPGRLTFDKICGRRSGL